MLDAKNLKSRCGIRDAENSTYGQMATDGSRKNSENTIRKTYKADAR